jgi:hypothetical protein
MTTRCRGLLIFGAGAGPDIVIIVGVPREGIFVNVGI